MPLEFIPNQPIVFNAPIGDYPCLNNDPRHYAQLMHGNDEMCVQIKLLACDPDAEICEPAMVMDPVGSDELGTWTVTGGWTTGGSSSLSWDGTGNAGGDAEQTLTGLTVGAIYRVRYTVGTFTGQADHTVSFGLETSPIVTGTGLQEFYFVASASTQVVRFLLEAGTYTAADTLAITGLEAIQWTDCWQDDLYLSNASWTYSYNGASGRFCSLQTDGGDLVNTTAFTTTGNYHRVSLNITGCTAGGLVVKLGTVTLGTTTGNGLFSYYGTPSSGTALVLEKTGGFDGCVDTVSVTDYGDVSSFELNLTDDAGAQVAGPLSFDVYEDRLTKCFNIGNFTSETFEPYCGTFRLAVTDFCDSSTTLSETRINYRTVSDPQWDCTKVVEAWSDGYAYGFYFGPIDTPVFKLRQRLRVLQFSPVYRNTSEEYLYSSGNTGRSYGQSQKARTCWFDYVDEYAHDTIRVQLLSTKLLIDGYAFYFPTEDYEPEWNERGKYNLAQSRVTLFHEQAIFASNCGTQANAICPPQVVIVPPSVTQLAVKLNQDVSPLDLTDIFYYIYEIDSTGAWTSVNTGGSYDITNGVDRAIVLTSITSIIDSVYGITSSGTFTVSGSTINLNITGALPNVALPQSLIVVSFTDSSGAIAATATSFS